MPRKYTKKNTEAAAKRGQWSEENLREAIKRVNAGEIGVNEASKYYGIPSRTLRRRRSSGILEKLPLGPQGLFGPDNEKRLVKHIQRLESSGFAPDRQTVRRLAYQFAEKLRIKHKFSKKTQCAGRDWLVSFLERNKELSIRQAEGLSLARGQGMSRDEVNGFFDLLLVIYTKYDLFDKPGSIYNMDESGLQLNNKPGKVIATKGAKDVHVLTSAERGENVTVIACCNAEGTFLPPVLIMKGKRQKPEFSDGLPPGSQVYMNQKSSYINSELFFTWLKDHFLPRKVPGKVLLILDGHVSHSNALDMLEFADANDILLLCLPSHTTQALQPLDRAFFKPLKDYFKQATANWMLHHQDRKITRLQAGSLIGSAWIKATSVQTGISGFRATGIYPYDRTAIPDHFFAISDVSKRTDDIVEHNSESNAAVDGSGSEAEPAAGPSNVRTLESGSKEVPSAVTTLQDRQGSPTKHLMEIRPIPKIPLPLNRRRKQSAELLTTPIVMDKKRKKLAGKENKNTINEPVKEKRVPKMEAYKATTRGTKKNLPLHESDLDAKSSDSSSDCDDHCIKIEEKRKKPAKKENKNTRNKPPERKRVPKMKTSKETNKNKKKMPLDGSDSDEKSSDSFNNYEDHCIECLENYRDTRKKVDWLQCISCENWMHETCTMYNDKCNECGREEKRAKKAKARK